MPSPWPDRLARSFAILRGVMLVLLCSALVFAPEKAMPGSSSDPARRLALLFSSRTILLGLGLVVLAVRRKREWLAWVLFTDAALQLFDTGLSIATGRGGEAVAAALIGAIEVAAGLAVLRAAKQPVG